jgi:hypothetical protein
VTEIPPDVMTPVAAVPAVKPAPVEAPVEAEPAPVKPAEPVVWPNITVSGVAGRGRTASAILGTEIVGVGEAVRGIKVTGITEDGVVLEYKGEVQTVKVGNSTRQL